MTVVTDSIEQVRAAVRAARGRGLRIGCVPTMGALHEGHLSLVRRARRECGFLVVTIFVNPTQFVPGEDYQRYPRTPHADHDACRNHGVDLVFEPPAETMYAPDAATTIHVAGLTDHLCGPWRPGHFDGVCTVVAKLLNIVAPDAAYFGRKDAQQLAVVTRMCRDLDFPVEIVPCPTVRESDGLAVSSRNAYLTPDQRAQAPCLYQALKHAEARIAAGRRDPSEIQAGMKELIEAAGPCRIDYISVVDPVDFQPVERIDRPVLIALAVHIGQTRLIDNILVDVAAGSS